MGKSKDNYYEYFDMRPLDYEDPYDRVIDRSPFKPPIQRKCNNCGLEFFEKERFEKCPKCGGITRRVAHPRANRAD